MDGEMTVIDIDAIANTAFVGINRAWIFMGMGVNCANDPGASDISLPDASHLRLLPDPLPETTLTEAKVEFGIWIVSNGLREAIETFEVFLERAYSAALSIEAWKAGALEQECDLVPFNKRAKAFSYLGAEKRLDCLSRDFELTTQYGSDIVTVQNVRNCLTHRLGIVRHEDVGSTGILVVRWHALELFGVNPDGSEFIPPLDSFPIEFPEGSPVSVRQAPRQRRFNLGERLVLSPGELKEICFTFRFAIDEIRAALVAYAQQMGVLDVTPDAPTTSDAPTEC